MRKHIFNAGPCKLPDATLKNTAAAVLEFGNMAVSTSALSADRQPFLPRIQ